MSVRDDITASIAAKFEAKAWEFLTENGIRRTAANEARVTESVSRLADAYAQSFERCVGDGMRNAITEAIAAEIDDESAATMRAEKVAETSVEEALATMRAALDQFVFDMEWLERMNNPAWRALLSGWAS